MLIMWVQQRESFVLNSCDLFQDENNTAGGRGQTRTVRERPEMTSVHLKY